MNRYHIVFALSGERDLKMLAVAVRSLVETCSRPERLTIHLLWAAISEENRAKLLASWSDFTSTIEWHHMQPYLGELAEVPKNGNYFRCFIGSVVPEEVERALYLDYDIIVERDITRLWDEDLEGYVAAAVWDACEPLYGYSEVLERAAREIGREFSPAEGYFNAGVLFVNLDRWREEGLEKSVVRLALDHQGWSTFVIQDELNLLLQGRIKALPPLWNLLDTLALYDGWDSDFYGGWNAELSSIPVVKHFAGSVKPFHLLARSSVKKQFYAILDRTEWRGWRSDTDRSWTGRRVAALLELHWLICRGLRKRSLDDPWGRLWRQVRSDPLSLLLYPLIPLYRLRRRVERSLYQWRLSRI